MINAHSRHFLALSVLFLVPLCFSITVYPSVFRLITDQSTASHNSVFLLRRSLHNDDQQQPNTNSDTKMMILLLVASIVVVTVFNLLAIGSIAYSVFQGFYGRPVKLISVVKSSFTSFFPLLVILISSNFIFLGILVILGISTFLLIKLTGFKFDYSSQVFSGFATIVAIVIVIKLYVIWILAWVIVVV